MINSRHIWVKKILECEFAVSNFLLLELKLPIDPVRQYVAWSVDPSVGQSFIISRFTSHAPFAALVTLTSTATGRFWNKLHKLHHFRNNLLIICLARFWLCKNKTWILKYIRALRSCESRHIDIISQWHDSLVKKRVTEKVLSQTCFFGILSL